MAFEWVGPVSAGAVGIAGILSTWLTAKQGRDQVERMTRERQSFELALAREARNQARLGDAYVRLLGMVERGGQWAQMVKPFLGTDPPPEVRPLPAFDEQAEIEAAVSAFGSDEVRDALDAWKRVLEPIMIAVSYIDDQEAKLYRHEPADPGPGRQILEENRPKEEMARQALTRQIANELRVAADLERARLANPNS